MLENYENIKRIDNWIVNDYWSEGSICYAFEVENEKHLQDKLKGKNITAELPDRLSLSAAIPAGGSQMNF